MSPRLKLKLLFSLGSHILRFPNKYICTPVHGKQLGFNTNVKHSLTDIGMYIIQTSMFMQKLVIMRLTIPKSCRIHTWGSTKDEHWYQVSELDLTVLTCFCWRVQQDSAHIPVGSKCEIFPYLGPGHVPLGSKWDWPVDESNWDEFNWPNWDQLISHFGTSGASQVSSGLIQDRLGSRLPQLRPAGATVDPNWNHLEHNCSQLARLEFHLKPVENIWLGTESDNFDTSVSQTLIF